MVNPDQPVLPVNQVQQVQQVLEATMVVRVRMDPQDLRVKEDLKALPEAQGLTVIPVSKGSLGRLDPMEHLEQPEPQALQDLMVKMGLPVLQVLEV